MYFKRSVYIFSLSLKIIILNFIARCNRNKECVILVAEFGSEGGALTYFKYILEYFESKKISYLLVLSDEQKQFVKTNLKITYCKEIIIGPAVWRPFFSKKSKLTYNLGLLINQLQELLFFSKLNVNYRPKYFYFSVTNPEHYLFEFVLSAKLIYICHTLTYDKMDRLKVKLLNFLLDKNKRILLVSEFAKKKIVENWDIRPKNYKYLIKIYNYYENPVKGNIIELTRDSFNVLTIGSVEDYKNPLLWCEIAKNITISHPQKKIKFYWVGSGSLLEDCKHNVSEFNNIYFEGTSTNVEFYYSISDIYIQPSKTESFGISVAGAMANNIPCIVSDAGGLTELILDNISGFVVKEQTSNCYIEKFNQLYSNTELQLTFAKNGYNRYANNFTKLLWSQQMNYLFKK